MVRIDGDAVHAAMLSHALAEGLCLTDDEGAMLWCNPAFARFDETLKQRVSMVCKRAATLLKHPESLPPRLAFDATTGDDSKIYEVLISPIDTAGQAGRAARLAAVVVDVSAQRRREARVSALDAAGAELVRLDIEQIRKMNTVERLGVLEQKVVRFAHDLLHFDHFAIRLIDRDSDKLELVMSAGLPGAALAVELYARAEGNGISGYVASSGRSYICNDTTTDPRYVIGIDAARSSLTVPLRLNDKVIGIFNVESTQANAFTEEDRQFAENFANSIALALHILNLLVAERSTTGQAVTGTVEGELSEPLTDLTQVAAKLKESLSPAPATGGVGVEPPSDPKLLKAIERILDDVAAIKKRIKNVGQGAATVLGADDAVAKAARSTDPILRSKRIVVADDDPRIRQLVAEVLRARGAEVVVCEDGATAVAAILRLASGAGPLSGSPAVPGQERQVGSSGHGPRGRALDLLISDIRLPDKTGYEIFAAARESLPELPVILMTGFGYDPHHSIVRASQQGLSAVLFKPFQAERLIEEAHKALGAPGAPAA